MYLLALAQTALGQRADAEAILRRALELAPDFEFARREHARLLVDMGRPEQALETYHAWLRRQPGHPEALTSVLQTLVDMARWTEATQQAERLRAAGLISPRVQLLEARALHGLDRHSQALAIVDALLAADPSDKDALLGKGTILFAQERYTEALDVYGRLLEIDPGHAEALTNTGACWERLNEFERAMSFHERAVAAQPGYRLMPGSVSNMASTLLGMLRCREALEVLDRGIDFYPNDSDLHWNKAIAHLLLGELHLGWPEYEWRWKLKEDKREAVRNDHGLTPWTGQPLEGRSIVVMPEQGLGDSIQFMRYAPLLAQRGARVVFCMPKPLEALVAHQLPGCEIVPAGHLMPPTDYICHTLSLPASFGTRLEEVPPPWPLLRAAPEAAQAWHARLGPRRKPRIGIVWTGNTAHKNDANRSMTLMQMLALRSDDWELVCLQKEVRASDEETLRESGVFDARAHIESFADTAALIENVDLVVSVDTSVAHLAGAMGKPVWILLAHVPDWRWMLERTDTPWYPSARLFRQDARRSWDTVLAAVSAALRGGEAPWTAGAVADAA